MEDCWPKVSIISLTRHLPTSSSMFIKVITRVFFFYYFLLQHDFRDPKFVQMELPFKFLTANNILPDVSGQKLQHLSDDIANTVEPDDVIQGVDVDRKAIVAHVDKLHFYEVCSRLYATGTCCFNRYC